MSSETEKTQVSFDVSAQRLAKVYAEALLQAAREKNQTQEVLEELNGMIEESTRDGDLSAFFQNALITREQKEKVIRSAFAGRVSDTMFNFLLVLNEHNRLDLFRPLRQIYQDLLDEGMNRMRVEVSSAAPLNDGQLDRIKTDLQATFGKEPVVETKIDTGLLGGVVVRVGDWLYDGSVRTKIDNLRKQLLERGDHEIQSGRDRFSSAT